MSTPLQGLPPDRVSAELGDASVSVTLDADLYSLDVVYGAAYVFLDRCYVLLDRPEGGKIRVTLADRDGEAGEEVLREYVGEFANEVLACAWRQRISVENRAAIEATTMQAIAGAMGPPSLEELEEFDFTDEPFEDPLGIAMSWEEKYTKDKDKKTEGGE